MSRFDVAEKILLKAADAFVTKRVDEPNCSEAEQLRAALEAAFAAMEAPAVQGTVSALSYRQMREERDRIEEELLVLREHYKQASEERSVAWGRCHAAEAELAKRQPTAPVAPEQQRAWTRELASKFQDEWYSLNRRPTYEVEDWFKAGVATFGNVAPVASPEQTTAAVAPVFVTEAQWDAAFGNSSYMASHKNLRRLNEALAPAASPEQATAAVAPGEAPTREQVAADLYTSPRPKWSECSELTKDAYREQADYVLSLITTREAALRQEASRLVDANAKAFAAQQELLATNTTRMMVAESEVAALRQEIADMQRKLSEAWDSEVEGGHAAIQREKGLRQEIERLKEELGQVHYRLGTAQENVDGLLRACQQAQGEVERLKNACITDSQNAEFAKAERDALKRELEKARACFDSQEVALTAAVKRAETAEARCAKLLEEQDGQLKALRELPGRLRARLQANKAMIPVEAAVLSIAQEIEAALSSQPQPEWENASPADKLRPNDRHAQRPVGERKSTVSQAIDGSPFEELRRRVDKLETAALASFEETRNRDWSSASVEAFERLRKS